MTRHSYHERDYVFGQVILKLRSSIGLTQAVLANLLGVSRRAVGEWEGGLNYPKAERLQHFIAMCVQVRLIRVLLRAQLGRHLPPKGFPPPATSLEPVSKMGGEPQRSIGLSRRW